MFGVIFQEWKSKCGACNGIAVWIHEQGKGNAILLVVVHCYVINSNSKDI
jgi:hypothetical protein